MQPCCLSNADFLIMHYVIRCTSLMQPVCWSWGVTTEKQGWFTVVKWLLLMRVKCLLISLRAEFCRTRSAAAAVSSHWIWKFHWSEYPGLFGSVRPSSTIYITGEFLAKNLYTHAQSFDVIVCFWRVRTWIGAVKHARIVANPSGPCIGEVTWLSYSSETCPYSSQPLGTLHWRGDLTIL
jgi:hypothetical protein